MKYFEKFLDQLTDRVIGALITGIVAVTGTVISFFPSIRAYLCQPLTIRFGSFLCLVITSVLLLAAKLWDQHCLRRKPPTLNYLEDAFFSFVWRWERYSSGKRHSLKAICPRDEAEIAISDNCDGLSFFCFSCGHRTSRLSGLKKDLLNRVELKIDQTERTGDWRKAPRRIRELKAKSNLKTEARAAAG